jgi:[ribosomal protein S5]-alanine N-acetyltransferase
LKNKIVINSDRFIIRFLEENDVTEKYLNWLSDSEAKKYIVAAKKQNDLDSLRSYVRKNFESNSTYFFGIFDNNNKFHIGNIKYDEINLRLGYTKMGILIGDPEYRGKGVAVEVLLKTMAWIREQGIRTVFLGVDENNKNAINAYEKAGFVFFRDEYPDYLSRSTKYMYRKL